MTETQLSQMQSEVLRGITQRFAPERIDRLWIFPPWTLKGRESGLFVLTILPEAGENPEQRKLLSVRYEAESSRRSPTLQEQTIEVGQAPPERIDRVIAGVVERSGADSREPLVETIEGDPENWLRLLERLGAAA